MNKNELPISNSALSQAKAMAQSDSGRKLLSLLQESDPEGLKQAMQQAAAGDLQQLQKTLSQWMRSGEIKEMMEKLGGGKHG